MSLDGSAIYEIEKVSPKLRNCENAFMMTNSYPNPSQTLDLWIPNISTHSPSKVSQSDGRFYSRNKIHILLTTRSCKNQGSVSTALFFSKSTQIICLLEGSAR